MKDFLCGELSFLSLSRIINIEIAGLRIGYLNVLHQMSMKDFLAHIEEMILYGKFLFSRWNLRL